LLFQKAKITFLLIKRNIIQLGAVAKVLKFKAEIFLLLTSIVLFTISAFCFSYATGNVGLTYALNLTYPLRSYAIPFVGFGSALMAVASLSYSKRSKTCL
jgi:hypothetical protein